MATDTTTTDMLKRATDAGLDAACAIIQQHLGVTEGDFAGLYWTGPNFDAVLQLLDNYMRAEAHQREPDRHTITIGGNCYWTDDGETLMTCPLDGMTGRPLFDDGCDCDPREMTSSHAAILRCLCATEG